MRFVLAAAVALLPTAALAHPGLGGASGFSHGLMHPLSGFDHAFAMVAVGLFAAHLGGRALWQVPLAFVAMMAVGGALGAMGVAVPFVETGIALSVVVLGACVALGLSLPTAMAVALVGVFAIFHGHAHGAEMPETASGLAYGAGFVAATAMLHALGIGAGVGLARLQGFAGQRIRQAAGAMAALAGLGMVAGWM